MFDRHEHHRHEHAAPYPQHVHTPAPPDQLRLLNEMRDAVREDVEKRVTLPNTLNGVTAYRDREAMGFRIVFSLNDTHYSVPVNALDIATCRTLGIEATVHAVADLVARSVAATLSTPSAQ